SGISSGSLEHSFPAAAFSSCRDTRFLLDNKRNTLTLKSAAISSSHTFLNILAKPSALDARSLASWKSSFRDRLVSITDRLKAVLEPTSRNSPVDLSSMPAISL
uniref:Uncharacterized protein n=1 Tax=Astyanax mexicanus TaxID=7994 RepID=A0A8B9HUS5_ASTMX